MKKYVSLCLAILLALGIAACGNEAPAENQNQSEAPVTTVSETTQAPLLQETEAMNTARTVTDMQGRTLEIPADPQKIVCLGPGALRLACYLGIQDRVVGIEDGEQEAILLRPYNYLNPQLHELPVVSASGRGGLTPFEEELLKVKPDVILMAFSKVELGENLQKKLKIPVVFVNTRGGIFQDSWYSAMDFMAEIFGVQERAQEIHRFVDGVLKDLADRTAAIAERPRVYYGAAWFRGGHSLEGTLLRYPPFTAANINHVADELADGKGVGVGTEVDLEKVLEWNPEIIFLDRENVPLVEESYKENPDYFTHLQAFQNNRVYAQLSYNNYGANLEMAIINAYYAGSVVYPEAFADIDLDEIAENTFDSLLGSSPWMDMKEAGMILEPIKIGESS